MKTYDQSINNLHKMYQQNNNLIITKDDKQLINEAKQTIISLAYSDYLAPFGLDELSQILSTISLYRVRKNEDSK